MHTIPPTRLTARAGPTALTLAAALLAPATLLVRLAATAGHRLRQARHEQAGVSEIAVIALVTGLAAILVVAYMTIISGKVEDEANNLPTSGN